MRIFQLISVADKYNLLGNNLFIAVLDSKRSLLLRATYLDCGPLSLLEEEGKVSSLQQTKDLVAALAS